jgi:hypothetical protein
MENIVDFFLNNEQLAKLGSLKVLVEQASSIGEPGMVIGQPNLDTGKIRFQFIPNTVGKDIVEAMLAYNGSNNGMNGDQKQRCVSSWYY